MQSVWTQGHAESSFGPFEQVIVPTIAATELETSTGITESTPSFFQKSDLIVTAALNQLQDGRTTIQVTNFNAHTLNNSQGTLVASKSSRPDKLALDVTGATHPQFFLPRRGHQCNQQAVLTSSSANDGEKIIRDAWNVWGPRPSQPHRKSQLRRKFQTKRTREAGPHSEWWPTQGNRGPIQLRKEGTHSFLSGKANTSEILDFLWPSSLVQLQLSSCTRHWKSSRWISISFRYSTCLPCSFEFDWLDTNTPPRDGHGF